MTELRTPLRPIVLLSAVVLAASLFFGGGARRGLLSDLIPQLLAIPLLCVAIVDGLKAFRDDQLATVILTGIVLLIIAQVIPLPVSVWTALPGREDMLAAIAESGGAASPFPISILPGETVQSALTMLPAIALLLAVIQFDGREQSLLLMIAVVAALVSAPFAMLQLGGGPHSPFYFFDITNNFRGVGFFANANHFAALNYSMIPLATAVLAAHTGLRRPAHWMLAIALVMAFVVGLGLSISRSALLLGIAALVLSSLFVAREPFVRVIRNLRPLYLTVIAALVLISLGALIGLGAILERIADQGGADSRWRMYEIAIDTARTYFPFGSGVGAFERAYQLREPLAEIGDRYVNHAHNDWIEIVIDGGALAMLLGAMWLIWLARAGIRLLRTPVSNDVVLARGALATLLLLTIHSLWDYPLRTIALSSILGLCCGIVMRSRERWQARESDIEPGIRRDRAV